MGCSMRTCVTSCSSATSVGGATTPPSLSELSLGVGGNGSLMVVGTMVYDNRGSIQSQ